MCMLNCAFVVRMQHNLIIRHRPIITQCKISNIYTIVCPPVRGDHIRDFCIIEPRHEISNNVIGISNNMVRTTSKASDQPVHMRSLIRAFASRLCILWVLCYWLKSFGVSKLKRRLVWVYTCQNATLLEITCHGLIIISFNLHQFRPCTLRDISWCSWYQIPWAGNKCAISFLEKDR